MNDAGWSEVEGGEGDPFLPAAQGEWARFAPLEEMFVWDGPGVQTSCTWVIAPDRATLEERWNVLIGETDPAKKEILFHPTLRKGKLADRHVNKLVRDGVPGHEARIYPVGKDSKPAVKPVRYGFRSFDRQWIIPDSRLITYPRKELWAIQSETQIYLTSLMAYSPSSGPAISFTALIPDLDHYKGSFGGRAFPLWADAAATVSNASTAILDHMADILGRAVSPEDHFAWIAGIAAHPAFTARFAADLIRPGLRVPLTTDPTLWDEGVQLGRRVIWLHTYGDRFANPAEGRPKGAPRIAGGPTIPASGAIPSDPVKFPEELDYEPLLQRLHVGQGYVENVRPRVRAYEVSGKNVVTQWFSYRKADRTRPLIGDKRPPSPLDKLRPAGWPADYTSDLIDLLHVLTGLVELEAAQADLLDRVMAGSLIDADKVLKAPSKITKMSRGRTDERQEEMEV